MPLPVFLKKLLPPNPPPRQKASITRSVVNKIVDEALARLCEKIDRENAKRDQKITKAAKQAATAAEDAAAARETVEKFVETAQETFRDVIAELLAPHYRYLEEHLGIKPPESESITEKPSSKPRGRSTSTSNTLKITSSRKPPLVGADDADEVKSVTQRRRKLSVAGKKVSARAKEKTNPEKKMAKNTPPKRKGAKTCPKK